MAAKSARRRGLSLSNYDYAQPGAYFVTICTQRRRLLFGDVIDGQMLLNDFGTIARQTWIDLPSHYGDVGVDEHIVMPNHVHGVVVFDSNAHHSLSEVVRGFKTFSARQINDLGNSPGAVVWRRGCYDHVVRNEQDLARIREYIMNNPAKWDLDEENPARVKHS